MQRETLKTAILYLQRRGARLAMDAVAHDPKNGQFTGGSGGGASASAKSGKTAGIGIAGKGEVFTAEQHRAAGHAHMAEAKKFPAHSPAYNTHSNASLYHHQAATRVSSPDATKNKTQAHGTHLIQYKAHRYSKAASKYTAPHALDAVAHDPKNGQFTGGGGSSKGGGERPPGKQDQVNIQDAIETKYSAHRDSGNKGAMAHLESARKKIAAGQHATLSPVEQQHVREALHERAGHMLDDDREDEGNSYTETAERFFSRGAHKPAKDGGPCDLTPETVATLERLIASPKIQHALDAVAQSPGVAQVAAPGTNAQGAAGAWSKVAHKATADMQGGGDPDAHKNAAKMHALAYAAHAQAARFHPNNQEHADGMAAHTAAHLSHSSKADADSKRAGLLARVRAALIPSAAPAQPAAQDAVAHDPNNGQFTAGQHEAASAEHTAAAKSAPPNRSDLKQAHIQAAGAHKLASQYASGKGPASFEGAATQAAEEAHKATRVTKSMEKEKAPAFIPGQVHFPKGKDGGPGSGPKPGHASASYQPEGGHAAGMSRMATEKTRLASVGGTRMSHEAAAKAHQAAAYAQKSAGKHELAKAHTDAAKFHNDKVAKVMASKSKLTDHRGN